MECKLCGSTTICAACKATIAADKDVENAALRKEVERLRGACATHAETNERRKDRADAAEAIIKRGLALCEKAPDSGFIENGEAARRGMILEKGIFRALLNGFIPPEKAGE